MKKEKQEGPPKRVGRHWVIEDPEAVRIRASTELLMALIAQKREMIDSVRDNAERLFGKVSVNTSGDYDSQQSDRINNFDQLAGYLYGFGVIEEQPKYSNSSWASSVGKMRGAVAVWIQKEMEAVKTQSEQAIQKWKGEGQL